MPQSFVGLDGLVYPEARGQDGPEVQDIIRGTNWKEPQLSATGDSLVL